MSIPANLRATVDDFILAFGQWESLELSDLDHPENNSVNSERLNHFLDDAFREIEGYDTIACIPGKVLIRKNCRRLQLDIARYYADALKTRPDIKERYEKALEFLRNSYSDDICALSPSSEDLKDVGLVCKDRNLMLSKNGEKNLIPLAQRYKDTGLFWF